MIVSVREGYESVPLAEGKPQVEILLRRTGVAEAGELLVARGEKATGTVPVIDQTLHQVHLSTCLAG